MKKTLLLVLLAAAGNSNLVASSLYKIVVNNKTDETIAGIVSFSGPECPKTKDFSIPKGETKAVAETKTIIKSHCCIMKYGIWAESNKKETRSRGSISACGSQKFVAKKDVNGRIILEN